MRILESALYVTDLAAAETFYNRLLGATPYRNEAGRHIFYRLDGQVLLLFNADETIKPSDIPIPAHGAHGQGHVCVFIRTHRHPGVAPTIGGPRNRY